MSLSISAKIETWKNDNPIRQARLEDGLTPTNVANQLGVSVREAIGYETTLQEIPPEIIEKLSVLFHFKGDGLEIALNKWRSNIPR